jgi:hypothetical protein
MKRHFFNSRLNIDFRFYANLTETRPFFICSNGSLLSSFLQIFIVLGMFNFGWQMSEAKNLGAN